MNYEKRIVLFLDILGFSNAVKESKKDSKKIKQIADVLQKIYSDKTKNYNGPLKGVDVGTHISTFSDNIVMSDKFQKDESWYFFLHKTYWLINEIIFMGFLVRGAIVIGDLYHDERIVFGPALNLAYELESKTAIYPRVIISNNDNEKGIVETTYYNDVEETRKYIKYITKVDEDGFVFVDYLTKYHELDDDYYYLELLNRIKTIIEKGLEINDYKIKMKYEWLKSYYNSLYDEKMLDNAPGKVK